MNTSAYRELFPVTRDQVFLNHAAIAALPQPVVEAMHEVLAEHAALGSGGYRRWLRRVAEVRQRAAGLLGATPAEIAFVPNTSAGLSLVAESFSWREGDAVLVPTPDFPANVYPWMNLGRRDVAVVEVPRREGRLEVADFATRLTPRVRMLVVSSVDFATGFAADLEALGRFCREHDLVFGVDAIQSLGIKPVDVAACGIDFLACGAHKWLLGPMGIGLLFIREGLHERLDPAVIGWKSVTNEEDFTLHFRLRDDAAVFEPGTLNLAGIAGLGAALELLHEVGARRIEAQIASLLDRFRDGLRERDFALNSAWQGRERAGILSFTPGGDAAALFRHFVANGVALALRDGRLRLAPHFYNDDDDVARFFAALDSFPD